jgi:hypothetical protein
MNLSIPFSNPVSLPFPFLRESHGSRGSLGNDRVSVISKGEESNEMVNMRSSGDCIVDAYWEQTPVNGLLS